MPPAAARIGVPTSARKVEPGVQRGAAGERVEAKAEARTHRPVDRLRARHQRRQQLGLEQARLDQREQVAA